MRDATPGGGCLATGAGRCGGAGLAWQGGPRAPRPPAREKQRKAEGPAKPPAGLGSEPPKAAEDPRAAAGAHGTLLPFLMQCVVDLKLRVEKLDLAMAPPGGAGEGPSARLPREPKEDREERILALLGIVGTVLNLLVVIFVYIYTTI